MCALWGATALPLQYTCKGVVAGANLCVGKDDNYHYRIR